MDSIGAEVGQKMRSAIKAKLMELDCYVDDELPDYIMVMVANRRTKSQMNEDLNLFLSTKTSTFVNWLHIVLKKLKEVTVTNPDVYKKAIKRKSAEAPPDDKNNLKLKKEKINKKVKKESQSKKSEDNAEDSITKKEGNSITDDLPISPNKLAETRKIIITQNKTNPSGDNIVDDSFDIPLLSEVTDSMNEQELQDIEKKIRNVKNRLGLLVESDSEEQGVNVKSEPDKPSTDTVNNNERNTLSNARQISILNNEIAGSEDIEAENTRNISFKNRDIQLENDNLENKGSEPTEQEEKRSQHKRITFTLDPEPVPIRSRLDRPADRVAQGGFRDRFRDRSRDRFRDRSRDRSPVKNSAGKKPSILDRLGKRLETQDRSRRPDARQNEDRSSGFRGSASRRSRSRDRDRNSRVSERFGWDRRKRESSRERNRSKSRDKSPLRSKDNRHKEREQKEGILSRIGVQSKIAVIKKPAPKKESEDEEEEKVVREVQSSIMVKPRVLPNGKALANKNLLLKAMADAHRSIAQTPKVGKEVKPDGLLTKKHSEKEADTSEQYGPAIPPKLLKPRSSKLKEIIKKSSSRMRSRSEQSSDEYDSNGEYIPSSVRKTERDVPSYIPTKSGSESESRENDTNENAKQQFIITMDGIDKLDFVKDKTSPRTRPDASIKKRSPSPIVFNKSKISTTEIKVSRPDIPDELPIVHPPLSIKNKERCRYWPSCRQGDKCEFVHPAGTCQMFPQCKFGENCRFLHPTCKFASSCTKRDCPYLHSVSKTAINPQLPAGTPAVQNCKFFPNCANAKCPFYHPKPCMYGKFCKNMPDCTFSHAFVVNKKNLSWRSK